MTTTYLKFIGKGQLTIPLKWRKLLGMESGTVKAVLDKGKVIIEAVKDDSDVKWDIESISLNSLPKSDQKLIRKGRKEYKKGNIGAFMTLDDFSNGKFKI